MSDGMSAGTTNTPGGVAEVSTPSDEKSRPRSGERPAAERWVEAFTEGWRAPESLDAFADHFARWMTDDVRMVQPQLPTMIGKEGFREGFRAAFELIPDLHATVHGWAADGDTVFIEFTLEGTLGGRAVSAPAVDRFRMRDGLVAERVAYFDPAPMLKAVATSPRAWPTFVRLQAAQLTSRLRGGGSPR
jgi:ketosteroid isomerase-like protein